LEQAFNLDQGLEDEKLHSTLRDLFEGTAALNEQQLCHRDLKPENAIRTLDGRVKIIDFGTTAIEESYGRAAAWGGDLTIHPPESFGFNGRSNRKTDSYSLFLMTYKLATGKEFFGHVSKQEKKAAKQALANQEKTQSFRELLEEDRNLYGVDPKLLDLMAKLGTANESERILAREALLMSYFANREVNVLEAA